MSDSRPISNRRYLSFLLELFLRDAYPASGRPEPARFDGFSVEELVRIAHRERLPHPAQAYLFGEQGRSKRLLQKKLASLDEIEACLHAFGVEVIALKGMALAKAGVPGVSSRLTGDVDILLPAKDVEACEKALNQLRYRRTGHENRHRWHDELFQKWTPLRVSLIGRKEMARPGSVVDLHWDPVYFVEGHEVRFDLPKVWSEKEHVNFLFAHLLVHSAHSASEEGHKLGRAIDIATYDAHCAPDFERALDYILCDDKVALRTVLLEELDAAVRLRSGDLGAFEKLASKPRAFNAPRQLWWKQHTLLRLRSPKDLFLFISGYLLRPKKKKR